MSFLLYSYQLQRLTDERDAWERLRHSGDPEIRREALESANLFFQWLDSEDFSNPIIQAAIEDYEDDFSEEFGDDPEYMNF